MKILGFDIPWTRKAAGALDINAVIRRLEAIHELTSGEAVNPENAMKAPTVQALVQAISRRIATLPVNVLRKTTGSNGRARKELLPSHPVTALLSRPNDWQTRTSYWLDATSHLVRYGNAYSFKARGSTGPIRRLIPLQPGSVTVKQDDETLAVTYEVRTAGGKAITYTPDQIHHARGPARDGLVGNSPVMDVAEAIALEIAVEKFGGSFFGNGAMPGLLFQYGANSQGFKSDEERQKFIDEFQAVYAKRGRFKALLLPKGIEVGRDIPVDNDKAQFLATRQYQRTVIAGAFGVPPHLVGDLTKMTFGNVEQQSLDFVQNVILPYVRVFEAAMERDLLTDEDRRGGVIIRFNLDAALRGDFKTRQEGLNIQRQAGVINANEWREHEDMNPIEDEAAGETYWTRGPSGQGMDQPQPEKQDAGDEQEAQPTENGDDAETD